MCVDQRIRHESIADRSIRCIGHTYRSIVSQDYVMISRRLKTCIKYSANVGNNKYGWMTLGGKKTLNRWGFPRTDASVAVYIIPSGFCSIILSRKFLLLLLTVSWSLPLPSSQHQPSQPAGPTPQTSWPTKQNKTNHESNERLDGGLWFLWYIWFHNLPNIQFVQNHAYCRRHNLATITMIKIP